MEQIFFTINPHHENASIRILISRFNDALKRYYRKTLGHNYYKRKKSQFRICSFPQMESSKTIKEPHIHSIIEVPNGIPSAIGEFCIFIFNEIRKKYPTATFDIQSVKNTDADKARVWNYCLREQGIVLTNKDFCAL